MKNTIGIIDTDRALEEIMKEYLSLKYNVEAVTIDNEQQLEAILNDPPDVFLIDEELIENHYEKIEKIIEKKKNIKIIYWSKNPPLTDIQKKYPQVVAVYHKPQTLHRISEELIHLLAA
ncbi:hypothetical protein ACFL56_01200 [Candidatus Margulisiibacteriota bacterium]